MTQDLRPLCSPALGLALPVGCDGCCARSVRVWALRQAPEHACKLGGRKLGQHLLTLPQELGGHRRADAVPHESKRPPDICKILGRGSKRKGQGSR